MSLTHSDSMNKTSKESAVEKGWRCSSTLVPLCDRAFTVLRGKRQLCHWDAGSAAEWYVPLKYILHIHWLPNSRKAWDISRLVLCQVYDLGRSASLLWFNLMSVVKFFETRSYWVKAEISHSRRSMKIELFPCVHHWNCFFFFVWELF